MARYANKTKGVIRWLNRKQGFGFIESAESGADVLLQFSELAGDASQTIAEGDPVEFIPDELARGLRAQQVRKLNLTPAAE
jgi:CspA family cold shock protein